MMISQNPKTKMYTSHNELLSFKASELNYGRKTHEKLCNHKLVASTHKSLLWKQASEATKLELTITSNTPFFLGEGNHKNGCVAEILHDVEVEIGNIVESVNSEEETLFDRDVDHYPWS